MLRKIVLLTTVCLLAGVCMLGAQVRLPNVFSDDMVLQRDEPVPVWGWAGKGETVTVKFNGQEHKTRADRNGDWRIELTPMTAGGPYKMEITGKNDRLSYDNILIGEVWFCSGQSNMEWRVASSANPEEEIKSANYPEIRSINVPKRVALGETKDIDARWEVCSPETVGNFTAVGYYFARELHKELGVPIGIINCAWGGTDIEPWTSRDAFLALPAGVRKEYHPIMVRGLEEYPRKYPDGGMDYAEYLAPDAGINEKWYSPDTDTAGWESVTVPGLWSDTSIGGDTDGIVWFKYNFSIPASAAGKPGKLHLGRILDRDFTWVNGNQVGGTRDGHNAREYDIPEGVLKEGVNDITVKMAKDRGRGGFADQPEDIFIDAGGTHLPLAGEWKYRLSVTGELYRISNNNANAGYSLLYNGMVSPFVPFRIKGAIWYQGENNASAAYNYRTLFPAMIEDWRNRWGYDFPFYWVQLANFMGKDAEPSESHWAELREAQTLTLSVPNTGQVVIIDIGEEHDIHPRNKQDVGRRLARIALNRDYGRTDVVYSGPTYKSMAKEGNTVRLSFDLHGSGWHLDNKYGYIEGFAVAGSDGRFRWAKAWLDGNDVLVCSDEVSDPVAVRFGWGNNPDVNLFNSEGLPLVPFRTDNYRPTTQPQ